MIEAPWLGPRIDLRPLLAKQQSAFLTLLEQLDDNDWTQPTICPGWAVRDVAAHVLGDHLGRLSTHRDGNHPLKPGDGEQFPAFLHRINGEWVTAARRISPALLIYLLSTVGDQIRRFWHSVDLDALGWNVSWAGPDPAPLWLDMARDFTEYWTHHQQIAEATGRAGLTQPEYLGPVLDTFIRALPHTLRDLDTTTGSTLQVTVTGPAGGTWTCTRGSTRWAITRGRRPTPDATVVLDSDTAWRLCTRGISPRQAAQRAHTEGNQQLTDAALNIVSIIY
ncbi:maleylpyruvate isomerase family mycothiol-dependent enzyme [Micromonospora lupini]|uniref:maleylpyruvate isomerase family mycothiol-dependent enzyme n=1 Tax=Micromonospora lupini TaxID=285679 RepID=UPI002256C229|nr:maleylpyruvate isomerase family mycothiol-dependent enzyme [Micromonospora lupini]MCX5065986.1 maleylpyruvate isomerase family mycothiol-dependent enzyme [Micromonospora lupini]